MSTSPVVPSTEQIAARWSATADRYDRWGDLAHGHPAYRSAWVDALATRVGHPLRNDSPVLRIADVGTGPGELALLLAEMGHDVTGYDIAPGVLDRARANAAAAGLDARFVEADTYELPLADASVDAVVNRMVLWTLYDPVRALHEWRRVLAPGGRLVILDGLHFAIPTTLAERAHQVREHLFWNGLERLDRARHLLRHGRRDPRTKENPYAAAPTPGMRWRSAADARAHLVEAGLDAVECEWLEAVSDVGRRTAPLRWRIAGRLPPFFVLTWRRPLEDAITGRRDA